MSMLDWAKRLAASDPNPSMKTLGLNGPQNVKRSEANISLKGDRYNLESIKVVCNSVQFKIDTKYLDNWAAIFRHGFFDVTSRYRDIKKNKIWKEIYGVRSLSWYKINPKTFEEVDDDGEPGNPFQTEFVYCRHCGLLIPLYVASVDHQAPQDGGMNKARLRLFRALGCTVASGSGKKSQAMLTEFFRDGMKVVDDPPPAGSRDDRYKLNVFCMFYYTVMASAPEGLKELDKIAMHSGFNLRPLCPPCNSRLQNTNYM